MTDQVSKHDHVLLALAMNLQGGAMVHLGKMADPSSGQMSRSLEGARWAIDVLEMLRAKCKGNTDDEIVGMLDRMVMDLQLNYMDELKKEKAAAESGDEPAADDETASGDQEPAVDGDDDPDEAGA